MARLVFLGSRGWVPLGSTEPIGTGGAATAPAAPQSVTALAGNTSATIGWNPPSSDGGSAITGYQITATPAITPVVVATSPRTVSGLTNGVSYIFHVSAMNAVGTGPSASSPTVIPQEPASGSYPWGDPTAGYAPLLRQANDLPDTYAEAGARYHTFGDLIGQPKPVTLTTLTRAQIESQALATGLVENFHYAGELKLGEWAHGVTFRNFVIDAGTLYGLNLFMASGSVRPSAPDRSDWPILQNFVVRGRAAQPGWNGADQTASCIYGGWCIIENFELYASKNGTQPVGNVDMRRGWVHWLHRVTGDHNGGLQVRSGAGIKVIRDVRLECGLRWVNSAYQDPPVNAGSGAWQTGSQTSAIEYLLVENCYFDGGSTAFNGPPEPPSTEGWASGAYDPDGYVKNYGYFAIANCTWGRNANVTLSGSSEMTLINPTYYDNGSPI